MSLVRKIEKLEINMTIFKVEFAARRYFALLTHILVYIQHVYLLSVKPGTWTRKMSQSADAVT